MTDITPKQSIYIEERTCFKCKETKSRDEFHRDSHDKFGLQKRCKSCFRQRNKEYLESHREYFKIKGKEKYNREENPARYAKYREAYLKRRQEYFSSVRGRLLTLLDSAKRRSQKNKLEYNLDIEWLLELFNAQQGKCYLTGLELDLKSKPVRGSIYVPLSPSLDRKNPSLGYTKENTRLVCTAINVALNSFGEEFFEKLIKAFLERKQNNYDEHKQLP